MMQFTPYTIDTTPAGSCGTLEKTKQAFGFGPDIHAGAYGGVARTARPTALTDKAT